MSSQIDQLITVRAETRAIFGEELTHFKLPAVIARLADLLPPSAAQIAPFGIQSSPSQPPIFPSEGTTEMPEFSDSLFFSLRDRLLISVFEMYSSLSSGTLNFASNS